MIKNYIKLFRLPQWIKNLFVFVPLLFSQNLFRGSYFFTALFGFFLFCIISSIVYIINDIVDSESDKLHPQKKLRPIPSGKISKKNGLISAFVLGVIGAALLPGANAPFILVIVAYLILNLAYSFALKNLVLLDIFSIAFGFMLRVIGGAVIINVEISSWLILTTLFLSLFLAIMKRQSELKHVLQSNQMAVRKVLAQYSLEFTNQMATVAAAGVIICYALYSVSDRTVHIFQTENLIYTTPFVVFGIFRYLFLVHVNHKGENATEIMISDLPMIFNVVLYILATTFIIYKVV